jgi:C_GCAxxG_C_C family probable redox protein
MILREEKQMRTKDVEQKAFKYHDGGFHCAEAVSKAIMEAYSPRHSRGIPRVASAFGGGIGRSQQDLCGALAGGIIACGLLFGRDEPGEDWRGAYTSANELRQRFLDKFGTTNCGELLKQFGDQPNMIKCKHLSGQVAGMLGKIISER